MNFGNFWSFLYTGNSLDEYNTGIVMFALTLSVLSMHTAHTLFNVSGGIKFTMGVRFKFGPTTDTRCAHGILTV